MYPSYWQDWDNRDSIVPATFDEALLWVLQSELAAYRLQLLGWEQSFRNETGDVIHWEQLEEFNRRWQERLQAWTAELPTADQRRADRAVTAAVEETLLNHLFQLQSASAALTQLRATPPGPTTRQSVLREVLRIFDAVNALRDRVQELLAAMLTPEQLRQASRVRPSRCRCPER